MNHREEQLCSLGDYEPAKINAIKRSPVLDYYMLLNARMEQNKKIKAANKK